MGAKPKLFVTGASSFVGAHFCLEAVRQGHQVVGLWRKTPLSLPGVETVQGELTALAVPPCDVVVHIAAKVMSDDAPVQNRAMLDALIRWGKPLVYASSTMVHWPTQVPYAQSRREDEARLKAADMPYVIVRPCAPYGPKLQAHTPTHKESFHTLVEWVRTLPAVPVIGRGTYLRQPVHVQDFAASILGLIRAQKWGHAWDAGGPDPLTMRTIISILGRHAGRPFTPLMPIPATAAWLAAHLTKNMRPELVRTFAMNDAVDVTPMIEASGHRPRTFEVGSLDLFWG